MVLTRRGRAPSSPLTPGHSLRTEVSDASALLRTCAEVRMLIGWSYGGLIALHLASLAPVVHVVAYEPVIAPFGVHALPALEGAQARGDADGVLEVALREVAGLSRDAVDALRGDTAQWSALRELGAPLPQETLAIAEAPERSELAPHAARVDLIVGARSEGLAPYGTAFQDVAARTPRAAVHVLEGQGHLAHLEDPAGLATMLDAIAHQRAGACAR